MDSANIKNNLLEANFPKQENYAAEYSTPHSPGNIERKAEKPISISYLINKLNYINFQNNTVNIDFHHIMSDRTISLPAKPEPCIEKYADFLWIRQEEIIEKLKSYKLKHITIPDGPRLLSVKSESISIGKMGISIRLPDICHDISLRKVERHSCKAVRVRLSQTSIIWSGTLIDFCTSSFRVQVVPDSRQHSDFISHEEPVNIELSVKDEILYTGACRIIRQTKESWHINFILEPLTLQIQRFSSREYRSIRQELIPSPDCYFRHPFTKKVVNLKVLDLSGSGFSVEENANGTVLLPGMIIPSLELIFANDFTLKCTAQIIYCQDLKKENGDGQKKCGVAFLDINPKHHMMLNGILHQAGNRNTYLCNKIGLDGLWDFLFKTGFIYPKKYAAIETNKNQIKELYEKLYTQCPTIARHFIYQDNGQIMGHMSMIRFFTKTWLIQHHAANRYTSKKPGLAVLSQIGHFTYDSHRLCSLNMNFLMCYFRPDNKFPSRVFGGAARTINDPNGCSIDTFAYFNYRRTFCEKTAISELWEVSDARHEDLLALEFFLEDRGGLLVHALDLKQEALDQSELVGEYRQLGLKKERRLFALKKNDDVKAIAMFNLSDTGLNLSDLTNCIKIFVLNRAGLSKKILYLMLSQLTREAEHDEIPIMLYPADCADELAIPYDKLYNLWILKSQYSDYYFRYINRLMRLI